MIFIAFLLVLSACLPSVSSAPQAEVLQPSKVVLPTIIPTDTPTPYQPVTPVFTSTPQPTANPIPCQEAEGRLLSAEFPSAFLEEGVLPLQIYLPPCYEDVPKTGYPLLVMLHGQLGDQYTWEEVGLIDAANRLISEEKIPRLVIVMPFEEDMWSDAGISVFQEVIVSDLMSQMLNAYPINSDRTYRAIGGYSRGANWAVRIAFTQPELFGVVGAHSYPTFGGDTQRLVLWKENFSSLDYPRFRIDLGEQDMFLEYAAAFEAELTRLEIPHEYLLQPGGHDYAYWEAHSEEYLLWYAALWLAE